MKVKITLNEDNTIKGYLYIKQLTPKLIKTGCNFDETTDLESAIEIEVNSLDDIKVNETKFVDGKLVNSEVENVNI